MPRPGVREGVRVGTGQRDRTATPNTLTEEREIEKRRRMKKKTKKKTGVQSTTQHVGITYIFITLSRTIFILDQKERG